MLLCSHSVKSVFIFTEVQAIGLSMKFGTFFLPLAVSFLIWGWSGVDPEVIFKERFPRSGCKKRGNKRETGIGKGV